MLFNLLCQLQVCCSHDTVTTCPIDGNWTAAPVTDIGATSVQLSWRTCGADTYVMGLRYLWRLTPCNYKKCAIYSVENELPAPPFIFRGFFGSNNNNNNRLWHTNTMNMKPTSVRNGAEVKGKGSFYIAQYPVRWTAQSDLHSPPLAVLFIPTPTRLLLISILAMQQLRQRLNHSHFHQCL